jgi:hypothetical protein
MQTTPEPATSARSLDGWTIAVLGLFLVLPWLAKLGGVPADTLENRAPAPLPPISAMTMRDPATFTALGEFVEDRLPLRKEGVGLLGQAGRIANLDTNSTIFAGSGDTLFLAEDFTSNCQPEFDMAEVVNQFAEWDAAAARTGKTWTYMVAPDKGAVLTQGLPRRTAAATWCAAETRDELTGALAGGTSFLMLWDQLRQAEASAPGSTYYDNDSHWTFTGSSVAAEALLNRLLPGVWDQEALALGDATMPVLADQDARHGIDGFVRVPVLESRREGMDTELVTTDIDGVRPVRTYQTVGALQMVEGTTVVFHDSMANSFEPQIASYFETIVFVHWSDIDKANGFDLLEGADHVVLEHVERSLNEQLSSRLLGDSFGDAMTNGLSHQPVR